MDPFDPDTADPAVRDACHRAYERAKADPRHQEARREFVREDLDGLAHDIRTHRQKYLRVMHSIEKTYEITEVSAICLTPTH